MTISKKSLRNAWASFPASPAPRNYTSTRCRTRPGSTEARTMRSASSARCRRRSCTRARRWIRGPRSRAGRMGGIRISPSSLCRAITRSCDSRNCLVPVEVGRWADHKPPSFFALSPVSGFPIYFPSPSLLIWTPTLTGSTLCTRHPLGLRLRAFRPPLSSLPVLPRRPLGNLCPTSLQRNRQKELLRSVHRPARLPPQHRLRPAGGAPRGPHQPRHRLEIRLRGRPSRAENQRASRGRVQGAVGLVRKVDC